MTTRRAVLLFALLFAASPALAKRTPPPAGKSVTHEGVTYSAPNTDGENAIVIARRGDKPLWTKKVFTVTIDPALERDVQHIYITSLAIDADRLLITDETKRRFALDLKTLKVTQLKDEKGNEGSAN